VVNPSPTTRLTLLGINLGERVEGTITHDIEIGGSGLVNPDANVETYIPRSLTHDLGSQAGIWLDADALTAALIKQVCIAELHGMVRADVQVTGLINAQTLKKRCHDDILLALGIAFLG